MSGELPPEVRTASPEDLRGICTCLASAFHDDPVWGLWAFPDAATRPARLSEFLGAYAAGALPHGWVRITPSGEAVAVWVPPGKPEMTAQEERSFEQLVGRIGGARAPEILSLGEAFDRLHPHDRPHYYLSMWATHRDHAGHGLGTALIEESLARIDREHQPAYLESTNPANLPRYEALGFEPRGRFGPLHGPVITTMWREAR